MMQQSYKPVTKTLVQPKLVAPVSKPFSRSPARQDKILRQPVYQEEPDEDAQPGTTYSVPQNYGQPD